MTGALGRAGLPGPKFDASITTLRVTLDRHGLLGPETSRWLKEIGAEVLDPGLQRALALVHRGYEVDDQVLRAQLAMDSDDARALLRDLVNGQWLKYPPRPGEAYRPGQRLERAQRDRGALLPMPVDVAEPSRRSRTSGSWRSSTGLRRYRSMRLRSEWGHRRTRCAHACGCWSARAPWKRRRYRKAGTADIVSPVRGARPSGGGAGSNLT